MGIFRRRTAAVRLFRRWRLTTVEVKPAARPLQLIDDGL